MTNSLPFADQIAAHLALTNIAMLELKGPDGVLRIVRDGSEPMSEVHSGPSPAAPGLIISAPSAGIFLHAHPLQITPRTVGGASVAQGDVVGFLRIGPLLTAVTAPEAGVVMDILAEDGAIVGYGTPLFDLEPTDHSS